MKRIEILIYSLVLFLIIYNPPIRAGLSFTTIAVVSSSILCIVYNKEFGIIMRMHNVRSLAKWVVAFLFYDVAVCGIIYLSSRNNLVRSSLVGDLISHISICFLSLGLVVFALKKHWSTERFCLTYVLAGLYQAILGVICLVSPPIKSIFTALTIANSSSEKIRNSVEVLASIRNYGFASSLYDIFGMTMSVLAVLAIALGLRGNKMYYMVAALITLAAVINSRTSFVLTAIGAIIMFLSHSGKGFSKGWLTSRIVLFPIAIVGVGSLFTWLLGNASTEQLEWLATAVIESQSMLEGEEVGFYDTLLNNFMIFPSDFFEVVLGTGLTPADAINHNSDVGYIQYLWKHGIIGSALLYTIFIKLFKYAKKRQLWPYSSFITALSVMVAVYLVKLTCLGYSMASVIFVPICLYMIVTDDKKLDRCG